MDNNTTTICVNGELKPGDLVLSTPDDEYACLVGTVLFINKLGTLEHDAETGNDTDSVHVNFMDTEYSESRVAEIEEMFSELYSEPKTFEECPIDDAIMSPDALIRITGIGDDTLKAILDSLEAGKALCKLVENEMDVGLETPERETPAQAALHEPDIYDDEATAALREQLIERIDANLLSYFDDIHSNADLDITCMSSEIAAVTGAHCYLSEIHNFHASELRYLLQFKDPLSVVADKFQIAGMEDYSDVMWDIFDRQDALQGDYERMQNPADIDAMKQELFSRLDKNLSDYCESLMSVDKRELIGMAEEITSHYAAREYLKTAYDFKTGEVEYLLRYQDPLTLVADSWPGTLDGLVPMKDVVTDILEDRGSHGHYARVMDADSPAAKESARDASTEKRSVLEQIREAPKAPKEQRKDKPARDKSGLEL